DEYIERKAIEWKNAKKRKIMVATSDYTEQWGDFLEEGCVLRISSRELFF
ncbi:hypothetical protein LFLEISCH_00820, partial [Listeria fleischmannii subsp. fleischmannii LU2006-1]